MTDKPANNGLLRVALGNISVTATGFVAILLLSVCSIIAANLYAGVRIESAIQQQTSAVMSEHGLRANEHRLIVTNDTKTQCVLAMSVEERQQFRMNYQSGSWTKWCPWVVEDDTKTLRDRLRDLAR